MKGLRRQNWLVTIYFQVTLNSRDPILSVENLLIKFKCSIKYAIKRKSSDEEDKDNYSAQNKDTSKY